MPPRRLYLRGPRTARDGPAGPPEGSPPAVPGMAYATLCGGPGYDVDHV